MWWNPRLWKYREEVGYEYGSYRPKTTHKRWVTTKSRVADQRSPGEFQRATKD